MHAVSAQTSLDDNARACARVRSRALACESHVMMVCVCAPCGVGNVRPGTSGSWAAGSLEICVRWIMGLGVRDFWDEQFGIDGRGFL